jgi:hypothetical protein
MSVRTTKCDNCGDVYFAEDVIWILVTGKAGSTALCQDCFNVSQKGKL